MKISEYISILFIFTFFCTICFAQTKQIDSLKKALPSLTDSARVSCLEGICVAFIGINSDSAKHYATEAYKESEKINNYEGMVNALYLQHWAEGRDNFPFLEQISRKAIGWKSMYPTKTWGIMYAYNRLGMALMAQSKFEEAIPVLDTSTMLAIQVKDTNYWMSSLIISGLSYGLSGNTEKAFEKFNNALTFSKEFNKRGSFISASVFIGGYFMSIEDYNTAIEFYRQAFWGIPASEFSKLAPNEVTAFAGAFIKTNQLDSARYYLELLDTTNDRSLRFYLGAMSQYYFELKDYGKSLQLNQRALPMSQDNADLPGVVSGMVNAGKIHSVLQNKEAAFQYAWKARALGQQLKLRQYQKEACHVLYSLYQEQNHTDSAFHYYRQYVSLNDTIMTSQVKGKLAAAGLNQKIELLTKDKEIQQAKLKRESLLRNIFIAGILLLLVMAFVIFRNLILKRRNDKLRMEHELELHKHESERIKAELQQQATELEMQALRAQMNPHFIFNSLNSINRFILQNNRTQASEYLTKFSKLVRMILQNSQASLITLESELQSLELYLDLEALRFDHRFAYKISVPKDLDVEMLKVPPLIIQPFAENAIWHGLMPKDEKGQLDIEVSQEKEYLIFRIADNGIGRKAASAIRSKSTTKHKSVGLNITANRIAMLHSSNGNESPVTFIDLVHPDGTAAGTEVIVKMPVITSP